jgi:hypothetical protein
VRNNIEASGGDLYHPSLDKRSSEFPVRNMKKMAAVERAEVWNLKESERSLLFRLFHNRKRSK